MIIEIEGDVVDKVVADRLKEILLDMYSLKEDCLNSFEEEHFLYVLEYFVSHLEYEKFLRELDECKDL
mgnify:FL=1